MEQTAQYFEDEFKESEKIKPDLKDTKDPKFKGSRSLTHKWEGMEFSQWGAEPKQTGYNADTLKTIIKSSVEFPTDI